MTAMRLVLAAGMLLSLPAFSAKAQESPPKDGQTLYNNACRTCHTTETGDNRLGPDLAGIIGRKAGTSPGFPYSESMKNAGISWDEATLDKFIENPDAVVAGNGMKPYTGMTSAEDRKTIIEFLKTK